MKKILIGSTAIRYWYPEFNREPKDIDYAVNVEKKSGDKNIEYLYNPILFKEKWQEYIKDGMLTPDGLLTLKMSHLFWDTNWNKHMFDTQFLLDKGCKFDTELMDELVEFWEEYLPKIRRSNLNQSKDEFFTNAVNENVDEHDKLHELLVDYPAYKKLLKDGCSVELDESNWYKISSDEKREVIEEESWVMQWERYNGKLHYVPAYRRQLRDNIQRHFPKYIALHAIINYKSLLTPPHRFVGKLK